MSVIQQALIFGGVTQGFSRVRHDADIAPVSDSNTSLYRNDIVWNGSKFVAVATGGIARASSVSTDGITWSYATMPVNSYEWMAVAWNGIVFCALGSLGTKAATSTDGLVWNARTLATSASWRDICWNGSIFCAVGAVSGYICINTSSDGITWTPQAIVSSYTGSQLSIAWNGSVFCVVGDNKAFTSSDGINWTEHASAFPIAGSKYTMVWNGSVFCAISNASICTIHTSSNGSAWTNTPYSALNAHGYSVGMGVDSAGNILSSCIATGRYTYSIDNGVTWSTLTPSDLTNWPGYPGRMAYDGTKFVVIGQNRFCDHITI